MQESTLLTKKIFDKFLSIIFIFFNLVQNFLTKGRAFFFFNFRKNAVAGTTTLSGIAQRFSMGKAMFQTVAAKTKRRTVDITLQIISTQLYVKHFSCINLFYV